MIAEPNAMLCAEATSRVVLSIVILLMQACATTFIIQKCRVYLHRCLQVCTYLPREETNTFRCLTNVPARRFRSATRSLTQEVWILEDFMSSISRYYYLIINAMKIQSSLLIILIILATMVVNSAAADTTMCANSCEESEPPRPHALSTRPSLQFNLCL